MEGDVVFNVAVAIVDLGLDPLTQPPQPLNVLVGRVLGRDLRDARFQQQPQVDQIKGQRILICLLYTSDAADE